MPKKKKNLNEEIPEELPEEELPEEVPEVPKVGMKPGPAEDREATWAKVDAVVAKAKDSYITGGSSLSDVIDSLIATLTDMKTAEAPGLAGLGEGPEMEFPPGPEVPPGEVPPEEEETPVV